MKKALLPALLSVVLVAGFVSVTGGTASASFHLTSIKEVYAESPPSEVQFVELQAYASGQNAVNGHEVNFFDHLGNPVGTTTFNKNVTNGANQATILIATPDAAAAFDVTPDFSMAPVLDPGGGKVCFDTVDCVAWGDYSGTGAQTPFGDPDGIPTGKSITRRTDIAGNADQLNEGDDTNNNANDFRATPPTPTNNGGESGNPSPSPTSSASPSPDPTSTESPSPSPSPSPTVTEPPPPVTSILKPADSVAYKPGKLKVLRGLVLSGEAQQVEVAIQKKMKSGKCLWWNESAGGFVQDQCSAKHYNFAPGTDEWTYELDTTLKRSIGTKVKYYTAFSHGIGEGGVENDFERGRNNNRFEVK